MVALMLLLCVRCRPSVTLCIVNKLCPRAKVTITVFNSLYEVVGLNEKSIGTKMIDLDLCLEVVIRSCQGAHSALNISETTNRKWSIEWSLDQWRHVTPKGQTHDPNSPRAQYHVSSERCYLATITNSYIVCCEAVWSAIQVTAWLLIFLLQNDLDLWPQICFTSYSNGFPIWSKSEARDRRLYSEVISNNDLIQLILTAAD